MANIDVSRIGEDCMIKIKSAPWFPYRTGKLKFEATKGAMLTPNTYLITFDSTIAPYIQFLEEGTDPHDIPRAFGRSLPFGIGGRFNGKFHPGSKKHVGFISEKSVNAVIDYIVNTYKGTLTYDSII